MIKQVTDNEQIQIGMLDDAYSAAKLITGDFHLDDLVSMIAKNILKFNHRPYHVPAPIKEYLRVRDKQHGKDPKLPHPIKKKEAQRLDIYKPQIPKYGFCSCFIWPYWACPSGKSGMDLYWGIGFLWHGICSIPGTYEQGAKTIP